MARANTITSPYASPDEGKAAVENFLSVDVFKSSALRWSISEFVEVSHAVAVASGWWHTAHPSGEFIKRELNFGERIALMHSELSECLEGFRKNLMCDKPGLEDMTMVAEEFSDTLIRIFDACGAMNIDLQAAIIRKLQYNMQREDHKIEVREAEGGKSF